MPREVQITKLTGGVQGHGLKKTEIRISALAAGSTRVAVAEELRKSLADSFAKKFKNVEAIYGGDIVDGTELVMLDGQQMPTAAFEIKVQFQTGEEIATPTPRVERKKTK